MIPVTLNDISKYLTNEVINKVFKLKTHSDDEVQSVEISRAAPAGEGLLSRVYRLHVTGRTHKTSFVVKATANDPIIKNSLDSAKYFEREAIFFAEVLPVLKSIEKSSGANENIQDKIPILYSYHIDGSNDYILLEDLAERDFKGLPSNPTVEERDSTLKLLAHLHATSMAVRLKKPKEFNRIAKLVPELYYTERNRNWYSNYLNKAMEMDREVVKEYEGTSSTYYKKFDEIANDLYSQLINLFSNPGNYAVINHGDAWCPNFLFASNQTVAIDFQLCRYASPMTDVSFFIMMCSNLLHNKEDYLNAIKVYYNALGYNLSDMGLDINEVLPVEALNAELKQYGKFGLWGALSGILLTASEKFDTLSQDVPQFEGKEKIPLEELWHLAPLKHEEDKERLMNILKVAVDVGLV